MNIRTGKKSPLTALLLAVVLFCTGCGGRSPAEEFREPVQSGTVQEEASVQEPEGTESGAEHIVVTYQTMEESRLADFELVTETINAITVPEIGVEVEFLQVGALDAFTEYSLWISQGKQIDLMVLNYQDIVSYINRGMLLPIDDYLEREGQDILALSEEGIYPTEASVLDGATYGVASVQRTLGDGGGIWTKAEYLEEAGIPFEEKHVYSFEELGEIFRAFKELYPDKYPLGQITSGLTTSTASYYSRTGDGLGGDPVGGVIPPDSSDNQVVNYYASERYAEFLRYLREWYLAGYIYPDAAFTDTSQAELLREEVLMSYPMNSSPGMAPEEWMAGELVCLRTAVPQVGAQYARSGFWVLPVTGKHPDAAMRFLNLLYADGRIGNLLNLGIEGIHYVVTDEEHRIVSFPQGEDTSSVGYYNPLGLYGDYRKQYMRGTLEDREKEEAYSAEAIANTQGSLSRGMPYSGVNVNKKLADLQEVVAKYAPILESGSVDIEKYYPEFLTELERAGVDEVIADKQRQLDLWLKERENP